jgi:hypothetical protein
VGTLKGDAPLFDAGSDDRSTLYQAGERIPAKTSQISRADLAAFILNDLEAQVWVGKAVTVTN